MSRFLAWDDVEIPDPTDEAAALAAFESHHPPARAWTRCQLCGETILSYDLGLCLGCMEDEADA